MKFNANRVMTAVAMIVVTGVVAVAMAIDLLVPQVYAAPSAGGSAQDTVNSLEVSGYKVIVNRTSAGPLDGCALTARQRTSQGSSLST
jgi:hypothetical protein